MESELSSRQKEIIDGFNHKSRVKLKVFNQSVEVFNQFKDILNEMSNDLNDLIETEDRDRKISLQYRDRGKFEAELKFADDVLIFSMHSDVFLFDRDHPVWKSEYVKSNSDNGYCGVISIYNFLSDSLKYNRSEDLGYLVARVFVNKDRFFLAEGKRQENNSVKTFGSNKLEKSQMLRIVESAILYTLSFDLLVPPFDLVKVASVEQINDKIESAKLQTGKRMGYKYNSDDILEG